MKKLPSTSTVVMIIYFLFLGLLGYGYGRCIYKLVKCDFSSKTSWKPEVIYGIGTCTGLGVIIGWFDLGE